MSLVFERSSSYFVCLVNLENEFHQFLSISYKVYSQEETSLGVWEMKYTTNSYTMHSCDCVEVLAFLLIKIKLENWLNQIFVWDCGKLLIAYLASSFFLFVVWSVAESFCLELLKFFGAFGFRLPTFGLRIAPLTTRLLLRRLLLGILPPLPRPIFTIW